MGRARALSATLVLALSLATAGAAGAAPGFSGWAGVIVAGDDMAAHADTPTEAFDNARRDVTAALVQRGFERPNLAEFSLHPDRYPSDGAARTRLETVWTRLGSLAAKARDGCLIYFTSHGSPDGLVVDNQIVPPAILAALAWGSCRDRPTVVILSACFSGVALPALEGRNRLVLTAARRDRSSFGCSESDRYPFFDGCVIEDLPAARDFIDLAGRVRRCVAAREDAEGARPRSRPQLFVGAGFRSVARPFAAPAG